VLTLIGPWQSLESMSIVQANSAFVWFQLSTMPTCSWVSCMVSSHFVLIVARWSENMSPLNSIPQSDQRYFIFVSLWVFICASNLLDVVKAWDFFCIGTISVHLVALSMKLTVYQFLPIDYWRFWFIIAFHGCWNAWGDLSRFRDFRVFRCVGVDTCTSAHSQHCQVLSIQDVKFEYTVKVWSGFKGKEVKNIYRVRVWLESNVKKMKMRSRWEGSEGVGLQPQLMCCATTYICVPIWQINNSKQESK